jgi:hypothetical protein
MTSSSPSSEEGQEKEKTWIGLIDESVHTFDDIDIGDIDAVSRDFVVVKRGFVCIMASSPINKAIGLPNKFSLSIQKQVTSTQNTKNIIRI